jgi:hypothetical protein
MQFSRARRIIAGSIVALISTLTVGLAATPASADVVTSASSPKSTKPVIRVTDTNLRTGKTTTAVVPLSVPPDNPGQGSTVDLYCNKQYTKTVYVKFTLNRTCGSKTINWGMQLTAAQQAAVYGGLIYESGMRWARGNTSGPMNSPHSGVPSDYQLHGTLNPISTYDSLSMSDQITFPLSSNSQRLISISYLVDVAS